MRFVHGCFGLCVCFVSRNLPDCSNKFLLFLVKWLCVIQRRGSLMISNSIGR